MPTDDSYLVAPGTLLEVAAIDGVTANDGDPDQQILAVELVAGPEHGELTLRPDGSFQYQSARTFRGEDTFRYQVRDLQGRLAAASVRLLVTSETVVLTEFLARNDDFLRDADGESTDWIELYNPTSALATLANWSLSVDAANPRQWRLPEGATIGPGERLIVFASGKDRTDPEELHTNFRLPGDGSFLAWYNPQLQPISQFAPRFPAQASDISYGIAEGFEAIVLSPEGAVADYWIPTDGALGTTWTEPNFVLDNRWQQGPLGLGYVSLPPETDPQATTTVLAIDFNDDDSGENGPSDTHSGFAPFTLTSNGQNYGDVRVTLAAVGGATLDDRDRAAPLPAPPDLTQDQLYDDFIFATSTAAGAGMEVKIEGLVPGLDYDLRLWSFDTGSTGSRTSHWTEVHSGQLIADAYVFDGALPPESDNQRTMEATLRASSEGELLIRGEWESGVSVSVFVNALTLTARGIGHLIRTDLQQQMQDQSSSVLVRLPFELPEGVALDTLSLQVQYDDGWVAYLNGEEVARRNAPGMAGDPLPYDAVAQAARTEQEALQTETIDLTTALPLLNGMSHNVLAIQGLNVSAEDGDFLLATSLAGTAKRLPRLRYFAQPSPGEINDGGFAGLVAAPQFSQQRGIYQAPFQLQIASPTAGATLVYTTDGSRPTPDHGTQVLAADSSAHAVARLNIDTTAYVRSMAILDDFLPSQVVTHTYLFLDDVIQQDPAVGTGTPLYPSTWQAGNYAADYQVDPEVVAAWDDTDPLNEDIGIREALRSLPTLSIVMEHDDLWHPARGIYTDARREGAAWQRAGSVEYFDPATGEQFQVNAGVQMHGGASRDNERTKKHSFRLLFREDFGGPSELQFPLFQESPVTSINTVVLKSFFTDGFPTRTIQGRYSPLDSQYLRDTWMRDVRLAMGNLEPHSEYVHLYLNGLYWGLYSPTERADDAFLAAHLGGERDEYDVVKDFNELFRGNKQAWDAMFRLANGGLTDDAAYQQIQGNHPDGSRNPAYPVYLDVDNLIDYMITHLYAGAEDWPHHNWYAARRRGPESNGFQFFTWDQEIVLDGFFRDRIDVADANTPAGLYNRLRQNAEFRLRFADRVQQHLFHRGALATESAQALWMQRANQIEAAILAESARWGDAREGETGAGDVIVPTMTIDLWRVERDNVHDNYFPQAHTLALERFTAAGLYPDVAPPRLSQQGGHVSPNFELTITAPEGTIYYTLDGSDPRQTGGDLATEAVVYAGAIPLQTDTLVQARVLRGETWSALEAAQFVVAAPASSDNLRISEVHYHPADATVDEQLAGHSDANAFEFVELVNIGQETIDLSQVRLGATRVGNSTQGVVFDFGDSLQQRLAAGARIVVVNDLAAFAARYGADLPVAGAWTGGLSNNREQLTLLAGNEQLQQFSYDDDWYAATDGRGPSLEVVDAADPDPNRWSLAAGWRPSSRNGGTPGTGELRQRGDFDGDGVVNAGDIDRLFAAVGSALPASRFDLTNDGNVDAADVEHLVLDLIGTRFGDIDLDGQVTAGTDGQTLLSRLGDGGAAGWSAGDLDGDGLVTASLDGALLLANLAADLADAPGMDEPVWIWDGVDANPRRRSTW